MQEMKTLLEANKSFLVSSLNLIQTKAASIAQVVHETPTEGAPVKQQTSAPSYLFSLKTNDAPPFKKPEKEAKPKILIDTIMCADDVVDMVAAMDAVEHHGLKQFLNKFLVKKEVVHNYAISEKQFLIELVRELIDYGAQRDFTEMKLAVLITIYLNTHMYFKWYYWMPPSGVWFYFKELMIRHTIEDSPDGQEVFEPDECYDILTHFHTMYLNNLPLIHIITFSSHRLKLEWPFKLAK